MHFPLLKYLNAFSLIVGVFLLHCVVIKKCKVNEDSSSIPGDGWHESSREELKEDAILS